jgi:RND family efflux transporter MFP subunit
MLDMPGDGVTSQLSKDLASLRIQRDVPKKRRPWGTYLLVLLLVAGAPVAYVVGKPAIEARLFKAEVATTEIVSISPSQATVDLTSTGYVVPQLVARIGANVPGRLVKVNVAEGKAVHEGDVLFEIDHVTLDAQIASAKARVASANARVASAKASVSEADLPYQREKKLVEVGAATRASAEDLGARVGSLNEQVHANEAEVTAAVAEVKALEAQLPQYTIKSPIDGVAQNKPAQVGDVVTPEQPLVEIADPNALLIEADVPEARIALVKVGQPCEVVLEALPSKHLRGRVAELGPKINRSKATATVKVKIEDAVERLAPDMSARVSFLAKDLDVAAMNAAPKIIVPSTALADRGGDKVVFVLKDGKVELMKVKLGEEGESGFELLEGPPAGTRVVKNPPASLRDGQAVKEGSS